MMSNSLSDLAYCAGLFDGEGCVSLVKGKYDKKIKYSLQVKISSTDYFIIEWVQEHFGGYVTTEHKKTVNRKEAWCWSCKISEQDMFFFSILPYSKIKRIQIIEALNYIYEKQNGGRLTEKELMLREGYHKRLKAMKQL